MKVIFDHKEQVAQNIYTFWFKPEKPIKYIAGQFTEIKLSHESPDNRGQKRWFTLSSAPTENMLSITTKFATPSSSFKDTLLHLPTGTELNLAEPMGDFVLPKDTNLPILFVAGGIGVTPLHSMAKWLIDSKQKRDIKLIYAANKPEELLFTPLFHQAGIKVTLVIKNPSPGWQGKTGLVEVQTIIDSVQNKDTVIYISGPEPMVETIYNELSKSWPKNQIRTDYFPGYSAF